MAPWEVFDHHTEEYRDSVLPPNVKARVARIAKEVRVRAGPGGRGRKETIRQAFLAIRRKSYNCDIYVHRLAAGVGAMVGVPGRVDAIASPIGKT